MPRHPSARSRLAIFAAVTLACAAVTVAAASTPARAAGLRALGSESFGGFEPRLGYDVSADGSVVVGAGADPGSSLVGFRWTEAGGFERIGPVPDQVATLATAVSGDGVAVYGYVQRGPLTRAETETFRWTADGGVVPLGAPRPRALQAYAAGANADGSVAVGWYWNDNGNPH